MSVGSIRQYRLLLRLKVGHLGVLALETAHKVVARWDYGESKQESDKEAQEDSECNGLRVFPVLPYLIRVMQFKLEGRETLGEVRLKVCRIVELLVE